MGRRSRLAPSCQAPRSCLWTCLRSAFLQPAWCSQLIRKHTQQRLGAASAAVDLWRLGKMTFWVHISVSLCNMHTFSSTTVSALRDVAPMTLCKFVCKLSWGFFFEFICENKTSDLCSNTSLILPSAGPLNSNMLRILSMTQSGFTGLSSLRAHPYKIKSQKQQQQQQEQRMRSWTYSVRSAGVATLCAPVRWCRLSELSPAACRTKGWKCRSPASARDSRPACPCSQTWPLCSLTRVRSAE